jgi:hypothetical protein
MLEISDLVALTNDELLPAWREERKKLDVVDRWMRWDHKDPHKPRRSSAEYKELVARSQAPWGDLIVGTVAQTLYVEGYRRPDAPEDSHAWEIWQANGMDGRQVPLHRAALGYGIAYGLALPGTQQLTGRPMPELRGVSPRQMIALYEDPAVDEWPIYTLWVQKVRKGFKISVLDEDTIHSVRVADVGDPVGSDGWAVSAHGVGVCPVVRYANRFDLEGRAAGEIEPFIPLLGRIDQTVFDRLMVQRFGAWVVRYVTGMDLSASASQRGESIEATKQRLSIEDMLVAHDADAKFGALPATSIDGYIKAEDADKTDLAAVSQTPAFEMLGQLANLSAEALAAAKASQTAKSDERKHTFGESHEQFMRLACSIAGDDDGAADFMSEVRWADTSIRSLAQAVDALGKLSTMLGFPSELLWPKIPGMTRQDVDEAKDLVESRGGLEQWFAQLANANQPNPTT